MNFKNLQKIQFFTLVILLVFIGSTQLSAQLQLERELIGAAAVPRVISDGSEQELQVDASFGESMIGYQEGDIKITVGFHQTRTTPVNGIPPNRAPEVETNVVADEISVNAYPNPTVERLTVDLGEYNSRFSQLRVISADGRTIKSRNVTGQQKVVFRQLDQLPNGNYFLQGLDEKGKLHQLTTIMIITY